MVPSRGMRICEKLEFGLKQASVEYLITLGFNSVF